MKDERSMGRNKKNIYLQKVDSTCITHIVSECSTPKKVDKVSVVVRINVILRKQNVIQRQLSCEWIMKKTYLKTERMHTVTCKLQKTIG